MTFTARYDGRCSSCGEVINAGDQLEWADDQAVHRDCLATAEAEAKREDRPTRPKCWLQITVAGGCGCDPE